MMTATITRIKHDQTCSLYTIISDDNTGCLQSSVSNMLTATIISIKHFDCLNHQYQMLIAAIISIKRIDCLQPSVSHMLTGTNISIKC